MRLVLVLFASFMLAFAMPALATPPGGCPPGHQNIESCDDGDDDDNGNGGGYGDIVNNNDNSNTNQQGQAQGQIQGQIATGGDATATGGSADNDVDFNFGGGEGGEGSFNNTNDVDNTSTATATTGDNTNLNTNIVGGGEGGSINIYGGEDGENGAFSNENDVDVDNTNRLVGGDQTTTIDNTDNSYNGGNTLIVGGGQGECYEGECEGGSGTLNSNAENNVDIDNTSSATGGEGGDATIEGGAVVVENNITVEGGSDIPTANNQTVEGDETEINVDARTVNEAAEIPVNSAAPSFSGICNSGAAGSGKGLSLSFAVTNDVCQCLMMADAYMALGDVEEAHKWVRAAGRHAGWKGGVGYIRHLVTLGIL